MIKSQRVVVPLPINTRDGGFLQAKVKYTVYIYYIDSLFPLNTINILNHFIISH